MKIVYTSLQVASKNMGEYLRDEYAAEVLDSKLSVLETPCFGEPTIVLSPHKSKIREKVFTVHPTGNWGKALFGGKERQLSYAYASLQKALLRELSKNKLGWKVSLEATHHGPTCDNAVLFLEIGSGEEEWRDERAAREAGDALMRALDGLEECEAVFGLGGGHYPQRFNELMLKGEEAVGHIAPKYVLDDLDWALFSQAVQKHVEGVEKVFVLKKETNSSHKRKIFQFCERAGLEYELI